MKHIYFLFICLYAHSIIGQDSSKKNFFIEAGITNSAAFNKSEFNSVSISSIFISEYENISNLWSANFNLGLGYSFSNSFEMKFQFRRTNFRHSTDGRHNCFNEWQTFSDRVEKSKVNTFSLISTYLQDLKGLDIEVSLGVDYHKKRGINECPLFFLGFDEHSIAIYTSLGLVKNINSNFSFGFRVYSSNSVYGWEHYGYTDFVTDVEFIPIHLGAEIFAKYNLDFSS